MFHKIETGRLYLRNWQEKDIHEFIRFAADPEVMLASGAKPARTSQEIRKDFNRALADSECYAIVLKETKQAVGQIKFQVDARRHLVDSVSIGYELVKAHWGHGYMTEALKAMICYAFEKKHADVVAIGHFTENAKSRRVIEKCGFKHEGTIRQAFKRYDGKVFDEESYSILKEEYMNWKGFYRV